MTRVIRPLVALTWRWALRFWVTYFAVAAILVLVYWFFQPTDRGDFGSAANLLATYVIWLLFLAPASGAVGLAWASSICLALRLSRGERKMGAIAAGTFGVIAVVALTLVFSDPQPVDLLLYTAFGILIGVASAGLTMRDATQVRAVREWIERMNEVRVEPLLPPPEPSP